MKKTFLYLLLLIIFGGGVYYFVFNKENKAFPDSEAGFSIKDTASIGKVFLASQTGNTILLDRTDSGWVLNNKYPALMQTVNMLLGTIYLQEPLHPISEAAHNRTITQLAGNGIKVEIFNRKGKLMKRFYVGNETHDYQGTVMLLDGAKKPYVVKVGVASGMLKSRYALNLHNWRGRTVFDLRSDQIKKVKVDYPAVPLNSFSISQDENGAYTVTADPGIVGTRDFNPRRVKLYFTFFENLNCEGYLNGDPDVPQILSVAPKKCVIDIETMDGQQKHLDIYWMPKTQRSKNTDTNRNTNVPRGYDSDRYYAVGNHYKDTMLIQEFTFNKVFRKAYELYEKDVNPTASTNQE